MSALSNMGMECCGPRLDNINDPSFSEPITGYSGTGIVPSQGQLGDLVTSYNCTGRTLNQTLVTNMSYTHTRGVGVFLVGCHMRATIANGSSTNTLTMGTYVTGDQTDLNYTTIPANSSGSNQYVTLFFLKPIVITSTASITIQFATVLDLAQTSGTITIATTNSANTYNKLWVMRVA
jgi:hypothetical protein